MGFFEGIAGILTTIGQAIVDGFGKIGAFLTKAFNVVKEFVGNVGTMIKDGFTHVTEFVKGIFTGDTAKIQQAVQSTGSQEAFSAGVGSAAGATVSQQIAAPATGALTGAAGTAAPLGYGGAPVPGTPTTPTTAVGGFFEAPAQVASSKTAFTGILDFFKSDAGQIVGKAAPAIAAMVYQRSATRNAQKMAESEARRQEEERRRMVMLEQQRQSDLTKYLHTRENETAQAQQANQFAGFRGSWVNPTTNVPDPVQL